jgi:cytochrome bd-type quinol oxidase subunit 2
VEAGPPILPLRVLGPFVVVTTLGLLGSGLTLIALGEQRSREDGVAGFSWANIHQAFFILTAVALGLHFLARAVPAWMLLTGRRKEEPGKASRVPGGAARLTLLALTLAVAGVTTALVLPAASSWQHDDFGHFEGPPPSGARP